MPPETAFAHRITRTPKTAKPEKPAPAPAAGPAAMPAKRPRHWGVEVAIGILAFALASLVIIGVAVGWQHFLKG